MERPDEGLVETSPFKLRRVPGARPSPETAWGDRAISWSRILRCRPYSSTY
jgi:hypothetical protein